MLGVLRGRMVVSLGPFLTPAQAHPCVQTDLDAQQLERGMKLYFACLEKLVVLAHDAVVEEKKDRSYVSW